MFGGYNFLECPAYPMLSIMQNYEGKICVKAKDTIMFYTGQQDAAAGTTLSRYLQKHYPEPRKFPQIVDSITDSDHIILYKTPSGQTSYAFSISGLEFLSGSLSGTIACQNHDRILKLIDHLKTLMPIKSKDSPCPNVVPVTRDDEKSRDISDEECARKCAENEKKMDDLLDCIKTQAIQEYIRDDSRKRRYSATTDDASTLISSDGVEIEQLKTAANKVRKTLDDLKTTMSNTDDDMEFSNLVSRYRVYAVEYYLLSQRITGMSRNLSSTLEDTVKTGFDETQQMHAASFIELQVEIRKTQQKREAEIAEIKASLAEIQATQVKHGTCLADIQATLKSLVDMLSARA